MRRSVRFVALAGLVLLGSIATPFARPAAAAYGATSVSVGSGHACALDSNGAAWCWGDNFEGQLGDNTTTTSPLPVAVSGGLTFTKIVAGRFHTCGIAVGGGAYCWGDNGNDAIGDGGGSDRSVPTAVSGGLTFIDIAAAFGFTCGITNSNAAYCWGSNGEGELGDGTTTARNVPTAVTGGISFASIGASYDSSNTCGLTNSGTAYCWGDNEDGQLGDNSTTDRHSPTAVNGGLSFRSISTNHVHTCGVTTANAAYCWGWNGQMQLGDGTWNQHLTPNAVSGGLSFNSVNALRYRSCGITTASDLYCWGDNPQGQVGDGTTTDRGTPTAVSGSSKYGSVSGNAHANCGTTLGGGIMCWGNDGSGLLGNYATSDQLTPQPVLFIYDEENSTVAIVVDPTLTFAVADNAAATCNGVSENGTAASATAVNLGRVSTSTNRFQAQQLHASTNAATGYTVYARYTAAMNDGASHTITDWTGSNGSPTATWAAGNEYFGYTTDDSTLSGTANRFTSGGAKFAALTTSNAEVHYNNGPVDETSSGFACIGFQVGITGATEAGNYSATVIYTAVPLF